MRRLKWLLVLLLGLAVGLPGRNARADDLTDQMATLAAQQSVPVPLDSWKFHQPAQPGGEQPEFDDSSWQTVAPGFKWPEKTPTAWFRTRYTVPPAVNDVPTDGAGLRFEVGVAGNGEIFVNGKSAGQFYGYGGSALLADRARPGQTFAIAVRGINPAGNGALRRARVVYDLLGPISRITSGTSKKRRSCSRPRPRSRPLLLNCSRTP